MRIGLFFGSFNPIHIGHMIVANYMASKTDLDQLHMVVSPQSPHKKAHFLANNYDRLHLVRLAIGDNPLLRSNDVEFHLPLPSYTIDTLDHLKSKYPQNEYVVIIGGDSLASLHKWKDYLRIIDENQIYVYSRPNYDLGDLENHPNVKIVQAPMLDISATYIRSCINEGYSIRYLVPDDVFEYLDGSSMFKTLSSNKDDKKEN